MSPTLGGNPDFGCGLPHHTQDDHTFNDSIMVKSGSNPTSGVCGFTQISSTIMIRDDDPESAIKIIMKSKKS